MHRVASERRKKIEGKTKKKMEGRCSAMAGSYMVKKSKGQVEVERSGGGLLLPAVEGHSLGTSKVQILKCLKVNVFPFS